MERRHFFIDVGLLRSNDLDLGIDRSIDGTLWPFYFLVSLTNH